MGKRLINARYSLSNMNDTDCVLSIIIIIEHKIQNKEGKKRLNTENLKDEQHGSHQHSHGY